MFENKPSEMVYNSLPMSAVARLKIGVYGKTGRHAAEVWHFLCAVMVFEWFFFAET